jgi:hypothetical protein
VIPRLTIIAIHLCIILVGWPCGAGEPIDPERLAQMRRELDAYYSRIKRPSRPWREHLGASGHSMGQGDPRGDRERGPAA